MKVQQEQVRFFHTKHGFDVNLSPTAPTPELAEQRNRIMEEEWNELKAGMLAADLVQIADGAADLIYTVLGTMVACGINLEPIFAEVHRSNMTKERMDPTTKKGGKGPHFQPARVAEHVLLQMPAFERELPNVADTVTEWLCGCITIGVGDGHAWDDKRCVGTNGIPCANSPLDHPASVKLAEAQHGTTA